MSIIVSGCPRSGTSVMMDCLRHVFGEDRILGSRFSEEREVIESSEKTDKSPISLLRAYAKKRAPKKQIRQDSYKDLNPNGFWECQYSVKGITYSFQNRHLLSKMEEPLETTPILKVVSQGLLTTDPKYITKVIYMCRKPRSVAKSQERLVRGPLIEVAPGEVRHLGQELVVHTPEMYIQVTLMACRWLCAFPDIPVHFVDFDDLQERPEEVLEGVEAFLGIGDFKKAKGVVEPTLNRSLPEDVPSSLWEDADFTYKAFSEGRFKDILKYFKDPSRAYNIEKRDYPCFRFEEMVDVNTCAACRSSKTCRDNFKKTSREKGVDWRNEPCSYECGMSFKGTPKTIQESIEDNFWEEE